MSSMISLGVFLNFSFIVLSRFLHILSVYLHIKNRRISSSSVFWHILHFPSDSLICLSFHSVKMTQNPGHTIDGACMLNHTTKRESETTADRKWNPAEKPQMVPAANRHRDHKRYHQRCSGRVARSVSVHADDKIRQYSSRLDASRKD